MAADRSEAARRSIKTGKQFESVVADELKRYESIGLAIAEHLHEPTIMAPGKAPLRLIIGKAPIDFAGTLGPASPFPRRSLYIECKHTGDRAASIPIQPHPKRGQKRPPGTGIRMVQLERAIKLHSFGAVVLLLWRNVDAIGILDGSGLELVKTSIDLGGPMRIRRDQFYWLDRGATDFLPTALKLYAR